MMRPNYRKVISIEPSRYDRRYFNVAYQNIKVSGEVGVTGIQQDLGGFAKWAKEAKDEDNGGY